MIFNQSALVSRKQAKNKYGEYTFTEDYIQCRLEMKQEKYFDSLGTQLISKAIVYTLEDLNLEDKITYKDKEYTIKHIYDTVDLHGVLQYYKIYLK
jgi:hypothetical protein